MGRPIVEIHCSPQPGLECEYAAGADEPLDLAQDCSDLEYTKDLVDALEVLHD